MFLVIDDKGFRSVRNHPGWLDGDTVDTAVPVSDDYLVALGYGLQVVDNPPVPGPNQMLKQRPMSEWLTTNTKAYVQYELIPKPKEVPYSISKKQFYMQAAAAGLCSYAEALNAVTIGTLPAQLQGIVDGMSNEQAKWEAKMQLLGSNEFYRDSPWVLVIAIVLSWTEDQIDDFWIAANTR